jgi:c-di-GMP-binding flagellar brake protein YcgR
VERRQAKRLDVLWQLNVEILSRPMPVSVSDISATGFSVETTTPFQEGEIHEFRFSLDGGSSAILSAQAAHGVANDRVGELQLYLTGFKFVDLDAAQKLALKTLLGQIQQYLALV